MDILEQLAQALRPVMDQQRAREFGLEGAKHDAAGSPITIGYSHGPGGNLSFPGVDPVVFHSVVGNRTMLGELPSVGSDQMNPTYYTLTGVQDTSGSNKNGVCDDGPVAGLMKSCLTTSVFGRYEMATPEIELNRLGQVNDRADPMDLRLVGSPISGTGLFGTSNADASTPADLFRNEIARKFWERNVAFHRLLSKQLWTGNPSNNSAGGGYKELTSFASLVNTGYKDAETGVSCPSVDSYVRSFGYGRIDGNGEAIVAAITDMFYQLRDRAERMGYMPVRWVAAMRPQLFYELSAIWPCSYLTYKCEVAGNERVNVDAQDQVRFRDEMRNGRYLLIDGMRLDVVLDDGIPESTNTTNANVKSGCFGTDIYLIPMSVVGGQAVTFLEYFQHANADALDALGNMVLGRVEGAFFTWPKQKNTCVSWQSKIEPRLVIRTPWLAARLQNVVYCPIQHVRDSFPSDPYHVDGGRTSRAGPSPYHVW